MKSLIVAMAILTSFSSHAYSVGYSTVITYQGVIGTSLVTAASLLSSSGESLYDRKVAEKIIQESQEFMQTGDKAPFLSQMIRETQELVSGASEADALEALLNKSEEILSK